MDTNDTPIAGKLPNVAPDSVLCKINIIFVAANDEEAWTIRRQIRAATKGINHARLTMEMTDAPHTVATQP